MIQDSRDISTEIIPKIKSIVGELVNDLDSGSTDYNFAVAIYANSHSISSFGNPSQVIDYMNSEYIHDQHGRANRFKLALKRLISQQFAKRPQERRGKDTAKVSFSFVAAA